jgi:hypothetical protein
LRRAGTALAGFGLAVTGVIALPPAPAFADAGNSARVLITNGNWSDRMLCASQGDDSVQLQQNTGSDPLCQWDQIGDAGKFLLYNPQKRKLMTYEGGNGGRVYMSDPIYASGGPFINQQYFSWGGQEDWGASALQSFWDSGQNVDAKDPNSDDPRTDPVRTRGWRDGHQRELTWNAVPVSTTPSLLQAAAELQSYHAYLGDTISRTAIRWPTPDCLNLNVPIRSVANGKYVTAQLDYTDNQYGMLRARSDTIGPWEQFNLCRIYDKINDFNTLFIRSVANGKYVSTSGCTVDWSRTGDEQCPNLMLRASADAPSMVSWDPNSTIEFYLVPFGDGYAIRSANALYVSTEIGFTTDYYAMLRARSTGYGPSEQFQ